MQRDVKIFQENPDCMKHNHQDKILITPGTSGDQHAKTAKNTKLTGNLTEKVPKYFETVNDDNLT